MSIYPKDTSSYHRNSCSTKFNDALFIIDRNWKQLRYPLTDELIKKMYIYSRRLLSNFKKIMKFAGKSMKVEKKIILNEVN